MAGRAFPDPKELFGDVLRSGKKGADAGETIRKIAVPNGYKE